MSTRERREKSVQLKLENLKGRDHLGDLGVDGKIILKLVLKKYGMRL
jgi:hypothetical protein